MTNMVKIDDEGKFPREELLQFYHGEFVEALKTFRYSKSIPTIEKLNDEMSKYRKLSVLLGIAFAPFFFFDPEKMNMDEIVHSNDPVAVRRRLFEHPVCTKAVQQALKYWAEKGWLDIESE
jgi:predicted membrane protein